MQKTEAQVNILREVIVFRLLTAVLGCICLTGCSIKDNPTKRSGDGMPPQTMKFLETTTRLMGEYGEDLSAEKHPKRSLNEIAAILRNYSEKFYTLCKSSDGVDSEITRLAMDMGDMLKQMADDFDEIQRTKKLNTADNLLRLAELRSQVRTAELQQRFKEAIPKLKQRYGGKF